MTPAARLQAAIEILDQIVAGAPAERALTGWARRSRFAGSKDRAAVRDHVFDALRCRRSFAARGGGDTGRCLVLGGVRAAGGDPDEMFTGQGHAPAPLTEAERAAGRDPAPGAEAADLPDWLWPRWQASLGATAEAAALALKTRAPVHLRVNTRKCTVEAARARLHENGVGTQRHPAAPFALEVTDGARALRQSGSFRDGWIELQDAASQAVAAALPLRDGHRVLDFCAGGGGKTLAMATLADVELFAHDAMPRRLADLPARADRAGIKVTCLPTRALRDQAPFDVILCDAPCSGSGSWRRAPDGKWGLTPERLADLTRIQDGILDDAAALLAPGGVLAYATCSVLQDENEARIEAFLSRHSGWTKSAETRWPLTEGTDGFFSAHLMQL